ncbi:transposase, partial [Viridibacillus sp. YIM B01967]
PSFKSAVKQALNRPFIIADRFHYCRYIYWGMDAVRRRIQKEWHAYDRKKCKRMRYVFYKRESALNEAKTWYLERYKSMSPELKRAHELKESFCAWFDQAKENGPAFISKTKETLYAFYKEVEEANIPEFKKAIKTLQNWQPEILNSFIYPYSNGFLEGINNRTKVLKRNAFGFKSFERFRAKILLSNKFKEIGVHIGSVIF